MNDPKMKPTESELEILQVLWKLGPSTVRVVNDELNTKRKVGYTTTLKTMQIMTEKNMLVRDSEGRSHVYQASFSEGETQSMVLDRMMDLAFGGSAMKLVMRALGSKKTSKKELNEIKEYLNSLEEGGES